jgi:plasmid replication initiation protein
MRTILMAFNSKYAVSLHENLAQYTNLSLKNFQDYSLEEFRDLMGVPPGRYKTFGELNKHVIKPAVEEVNALAPFGLSLLPIKQGKRVVQIKIGWWTKDNSQLHNTFDELQRSKVGRRARISDNTEHVADPVLRIENSPPRLVGLDYVKGRLTLGCPNTS